MADREAADLGQGSASLAGRQLVLFEVKDAVAIITLNRPEARNALSGALLKDLTEAINQLELRDDVAVGILTGADPAFCAGLDLKELAAGTIRPLLQSEAEAGAGSEMFRRRPWPFRAKPLIGAVNGPAITGGLELALNCDFLVASERARFADTHARVGVQPSWGMTVLLPEAIGIRRAREMSTTGNFVDAVTALDWGLVNHVVPHEELLRRAKELAADIAGNDQASVRRLLTTYQEGSMGTQVDAWRAEAAAALDWLRAGRAQGADIGARTQAIKERGRAQIR
jgi:enoyl-CoA hydratase